MTAVTVYIIQQARPWLAAEQFQAQIKTTASGASWAIVGRLNDRRFKLGATAFLTSEAAEMRRVGLCAKNLRLPFVRMAERLGLERIVDASAKAQPPRVYQGQVATR